MNEKRAELDELLAGKATGELDLDEQARLDQMGAELPAFAVEEFDLLVGEVTAALVQSEAEPMPRALQDRIIRIAKQGSTARPSTQGSEARDASRPASPTQSSRSGGGWVAWSGWAVAAAVTALWLGGVGQPEPPGEPTLSAQRAQLIQAGADAVEVEWSATEDPAAAGASGDVVWSNQTQSGIMRFVGLQANDPTQLRYQLWIFDAARDERYPIDGGLFDVQEGATEVLVPIDARLRVVEPTLFAVTVERSDGVVVSDRVRIVVVAPITSPTQTGQ